MDDFVKALNGAKGDLDAWLECNNEAECRVAIFAAIEDSVAEERKRIACAVHALERISRWVGEFPETGRFWDEPKNAQPMSYSACYGSNGERDYMRKVALDALAIVCDDAQEE